MSTREVLSMYAKHPNLMISKIMMIISNHHPHHGRALCFVPAGLQVSPLIIPLFLAPPLLSVPTPFFYTIIVIIASLCNLLL